jgi:hypothetical protein
MRRSGVVATATAIVAMPLLFGAGVLLTDRDQPGATMQGAEERAVESFTAQPTEAAPAGEGAMPARQGAVMMW